MNQHLSTYSKIIISCIVAWEIKWLKLKIKQAFSRLAMQWHFWNCDFVKQALSNGSCSSNSALRNKNQHDPSCFTWLTRSLEDDLTRQQKKTEDQIRDSKERARRCPRDLLEVWATLHHRGLAWSQCGPERDRRKVRWKSSPPVSCYPSGSTHCPGSVCHYLRWTRKEQGQIHPQP